MIIGTGIDITDIARLKRAIDRNGDRFLKRVFTERELSFCRKRKEFHQHIAARFAAKEAAMKALSTGWNSDIRWKDIEVMTNKAGAPSLLFSGKAERLFKKMGGTKAHLSLSHLKDLAAASVILES